MILCGGDWDCSAKEASPILFGHNLNISGCIMNESGYWILRCQHRLLTISGDAQSSLFPWGLAADFGQPEHVLPVGELNGLACYAAEVEAWVECHR